MKTIKEVLNFLEERKKYREEVRDYYLKKWEKDNLIKYYELGIKENMVCIELETIINKIKGE